MSLTTSSSSVSGLLLHPGNPYKRPSYPGLHFIPLNFTNNDDNNNLVVHEERDKDGEFEIPKLSDIMILSSCHGIVCCSGYNHNKSKYGYHVLNPTTNQFTTLPDPHLDGLEALCLAFNPSISPLYKVVSVWNHMENVSGNQWEVYYHIEIYSSETGSWRASGDTFTSDAHHLIFQGGVYWRGSIHWWCDWGDALYFNVQEERLGKLPMPPVPDGREWYDRGLRYQLESRDHLHMIDIYSPMLTQFNVFELESDYLCWFVKYRVDLDTVAGVFPKMKNVLNSDQPFFAYSVLSLVREEKDGESYLLLHIPGKLIRYNLVDKTFGALRELGADDNALTYFSANAYQYIQSCSSL